MNYNMFKQFVNMCNGSGKESPVTVLIRNGNTVSENEYDIAHVSTGFRGNGAQLVIEIEERKV